MRGRRRWQGVSHASFRLESVVADHPLFPCWGRHARMGHNVLIGHFEVMPGSTGAICRVPDMPADPETFRLAAAGSVHVVPMDGPAFFGFDVITEAEAHIALVARQDIDWASKAAAREMRRLTDGAEIAEEVDYDPDHDEPYDADGHDRVVGE